MSKRKSLLVIYRCCENENSNLPKRISRPKWFSKRRCLNNAMDVLVKSALYDPLFDLDVTFHAVHDGMPNELYKELAACQNGTSVILEKINCQSNGHSYKHCLDLITLKSHNYDYIYMLEDDYLHTDNALPLLIDGLDKFGLVTGYFHKDRLTRSDDITRGLESFGATRTSHWVTNESTTCTWAASKASLPKVLSAAYKYNTLDREMWRSLAKEKIRLWVPTPGFSTHLEENLMTPFIDWEEVNSGH